MSEYTLPALHRPAVYIIHDNPEWIPPFDASLRSVGVEYIEWLITEGDIDLSSPPPEGIFWSRLSASSHTRADANVKEYGRAVLVWLEAAGRTIINGPNVYELEISKIRQHRALENFGFNVPKTKAVFGHHGLVQAAANFALPFITKHNQGGKGLGVRRFDSLDELERGAAKFAPEGEDAPIDGITLIQEYVQPAESFITRAEFIAGQFHYAVKVDVSAGSFELCPADTCEIPGGAEQFIRRDEITSQTPLIRKLEAFLEEHGIEIAGVEFIETSDGEQFVYDINTNTNYNPTVEITEESAGRVPATRQIAKFLSEELAHVQTGHVPLSVG